MHIALPLASFYIFPFLLIAYRLWIVFLVEMVYIMINALVMVTSDNKCGLVMPSLHFACDDLTTIVRCLNSNYRAVSVRRPYDIVRFLDVVGSP